MNIGRFIRDYLIAFVVLAALGVLFYWALYYQSLNSIRSDLKLESNQLINQLTNKLNIISREIHSDIHLLSEQYVVHNHQLTDDDTLLNKTIGLLWSSMAKQRKRYDQIRFLDINGQELIRINYNDGHPLLVDQVHLQSKKHRYYFSEALGAEPGTVTTSYLDLNIEHHQVELPLKPTLRFSTKVDTPAGKTLGIIILNYMAKNMLDEFLNISAGYSGNAMLLNWQGFSLQGQDATHNWSFMFPDNPQMRIGVQHQDAWQTIQHQTRGQLLNDKGLYTFERIDPSSKTGLTKECTHCLRILLYIPQKVIKAQSWRSLSYIAPMLVIIFIVLAAMVGTALWHREKRRINEYQIKKLNRKISHEHELFISSPGVIAKLRNELGWPIEFVSDNIEELLGYPPDYFQTGKISYSSLLDAEYLNQYTQETQKADRNRFITFKREPYQVIDRQQKPKWLQDTTHVIRNKHGKLTHFYVHLTDITPLKEAEYQLTQSHDYIQKVLDTIPDPTMVIDINTYQLELLNQSALNLYSKTQQIDRKMTCYQLTHKRTIPCQGNLDICPIKEIIQTQAPISVIHKHFDANGNIMHVDIRATPIFDDTGENIIQIIESHRDITETVEMEKQLLHIAETDRLTQIYNRMKFDEELKNMIAWASLTHNRFGLIMLDLDHFKQINDTFGHDKGDHVLKHTVELMHKRMRKSDMLARWGGEEFMIIAPLIDHDELSILVESLRSAVEQYHHEDIGQVTASFGATVVKPSDNIDSLIKRVDSALYVSKQNGRNRCTLL
jgi:diguanylate cyclase (GGDEF)-like protein